MTSTTGKINVQTENIFPIIKKFLYSDHEIFLRELVSNAVDATKKIQALSTMGEAKGELGELFVRVAVDKDKKTITISDRGIGMTAEEVEKYITQVAFSGAEEFVQKYKDKTDAVNSIIGHFGLGFYSAFMVAAKVELITKSYQSEGLVTEDGAPAVKWECDGSPEYVITPAEREFRGTDIILHVAEDSLEFLEEGRISGILEKYCRFLPVPIQFGEEKEKVKNDAGEEIELTHPHQINNTNPAWTKKPADLTDEDYKSFYRELYPMNFEDPLFWIHLNVDYPFNLTGILYFPKIKKSFEMPKDKIQLYSNQVFVTDSVEQIVPDFLTLLRGVIDSPDIPLNVSRSYLQSDGNVKKISSHITKKVADKLEELFKKDREDFEKKYEDIRIFIQYGMLSDDKFWEKAKKFALLRNTDGKMFTLEEYAERVKPIQTDKSEKVVYLYANDVHSQHSYIETAKDRGYDVLVMDNMIDPHFINFLESKLDNTSFVRVDSDTIDKLIKKDEPMPSKLSDEEKEALRPLVEEQLPKEQFNVMFESLSETDAPMLVTRPEFMRRMKDMSALGGGMNMFGNMPEMHNLVINTNHPLVTKIVGEKDAEVQKHLIKQSTDLALLAQGLLKGEELTKFIKRSVEVLSVRA